MKKFQELLISGIDEEITGSTVERLTKVKQIFESEMVVKGNDRLQPSPELCQDLLQGLCNTIHIPWENYKIIEWYQGHLKRTIDYGVSERGYARAETLLEKYWPQCGRSLYKLLYS